MLRVEHLSKTYLVAGQGAAGGIRDVSFDVGPAEFFTLLGPSGCGKSTTLRCVAGLEQPGGGRIAIGGKPVFDSGSGVFVRASDRDIGMVFQSYAVWPHMSVFDNVAFPLKMLRSGRPGRQETAAKVDRVLETVGLAQYRRRFAAQLSGGQQQRLALARALVAEPQLLLLDEPLSNLDALLRDQMRAELRRLQKEVGIATVYVTHDQSEALALSDRIAVMQEGEIVQIGTPKEIYFRPESEFVATFVGRSNLLHGRISAAVRAGGEAVVDTPIGAVACSFPAGAASAGEAVAVMIRPEHVVLRGGQVPGDVANHFRGELMSAVFLGEATEYCVRLRNGVDIVQRGLPDAALQEGSAMDVYLPPDKVLALGVAGTRSAPAAPCGDAVSVGQPCPAEEV